jgi:hypothetical protein
MNSAAAAEYPENQLLWEEKAVSHMTGYKFRLFFVRLFSSVSIRLGAGTTPTKLI